MAADASLPPAAQLLRAAGGDAQAPAPAAASSAVSAAAAPAVLTAGPIAAPLACALHAEWRLLEEAYMSGLSLCLGRLREQRALLLAHVAAQQAGFCALLVWPEPGKQQLVDVFAARFNSVEGDVRRAKEGQVRAAGGPSGNAGRAAGRAATTCCSSTLKKPIAAMHAGCPATLCLMVCRGCMPLTGGAAAALRGAARCAMGAV